MNDEIKSLAHDFANSLAESHFSDARSFLVPILFKEWTREKLEFEMKDMLEYAEPDTNIKNVVVMETLNDWPEKQPNDVGWVYITLAGESFSEAISVIITKSDDGLKVREIEWGRP